MDYQIAECVRLCGQTVPVEVGGTLEDSTTPGAAIEPIYREAYIESQVIDLDGTYDADHWSAHGQLGYTQAEGGSDRDQNYWFEGDTREVINLRPSAIEVSYPDLEPTDPAALHLVPDNLRDWVRKMEEQEFYVQGDVTFDLNAGWLRAVKTGVKLRDDTVENTRHIGRVSATNPRRIFLNRSILTPAGPSATAMCSATKRWRGTAAIASRTRRSRIPLRSS